MKKKECMNKRYFIINQQEAAEEKLIPDNHEYLFRFLSLDLTTMEAEIRRAIRACTAPESLIDSFHEIHPYFNINREAAEKCLLPEIAYCIGNEADTENAHDKMVEKYGNLFEKHCISENISFNMLGTIQKDAELFIKFLLDDSNVMSKYRKSTRIMLYRLAADNGSRCGCFTEKNIFHTIEKEKTVNTEELTMEKIIELADMFDQYQQAEYRKEIYIPSFQSLIWYELYGLLDNDIRLSKCRECGRYLIVTEENDSYCTIRDPDGTTCLSRHQHKDWKKKRQEIYRKHYHKHLMRVKKKLEDEETFKNWKDTAAAERKYASRKNMLPEEFDKRL